MRLVLVVLVALAVTACKKAEGPTPAQAPAAGAPAAAAGGVRGKVLERIDAAPYSYLKIASASGEVWAAVPQAPVNAGDEVVIENPMPMDGFESKTLNRKFEKLYFGTLGGQGGAAQAGAPAGMPPAGGMPPGAAPEAGQMPPGGMPPPGMAAQHAAAAAGPTDVGDVKVPKATGKDAKTVAEVHAQKAQLKEKKVTVRGKVVKANAGIMGKNWFHIRDGSGSQEKGDNDITITSDANASVGDVIVVVGVVRVDKDFGAGYAYPVIIEEATFTK
ncbi:MAG TPA: nucleotide-binding protein [Anaeromyxobacteraceae bacterium]|nr:nucleotide-binding protein [Anaeromyxobacteraceae bacterium]